MNRGAAAACYFPIPLLAWLVARAAPQDRLVRHHARQAGWLTVILWALLTLGGFMLQPPGLQAFAGTLVGFAVLGIMLGVASAAAGRFLRLRPLWDLAAALAPRRGVSGSRSPGTQPPAGRP